MKKRLWHGLTEWGASARLRMPVSLTRLKKSMVRFVVSAWNHLVNALSRLFQQSNVEGKRQDGLRPLWRAPVLLGSLWLGSVYVVAEAWMVMTLFWLFVGSLALYVLTCFGCMWWKPEMMWSEEFALSKYAIQEVSLGDSQIGELDLTGVLRLERRARGSQKREGSH